jgi:hypothetical protein
MSAATSFSASYGSSQSTGSGGSSQAAEAAGSRTGASCWGPGARLGGGSGSAGVGALVVAFGHLEGAAGANLLEPEGHPNWLRHCLSHHRRQMAGGAARPFLNLYSHARQTRTAAHVTTTLCTPGASGCRSCRA